MKSIYIILSQSGTEVSKMIKFVTKDKYNHSSICLDKSFGEFYSFGRKYPYLALPGGFIIENAFKNTFGKFEKIPCVIIEKKVTDEQYYKLSNIIKEFIKNRQTYSYAIISLFLADTNFSMTNKNKYFCSQFVAKVLNDINIETPNIPEHSHPMDFLEIDGVKIIYEGDLKKFCALKT